MVLAAGYAALLYGTDRYYGRVVKWLLAALRFTVVLVLALLLLQPVLRYTNTETDPARVVLALDNSQSMQALGAAPLAQLTTGLSGLKQRLEEKSIAVDVQKLQGSSQSLDSLRFTAPATSLSVLLTGVRESYENRHLNAVVLVSDGLYNQGVSPEFLPSRVPVYTVGYGDTVPKQDIALRGVACNRISYLGNKFPISVQLYQYGYGGQTVRVSVAQDGKELAGQNLTLSKGTNLTEVNLLVQATKAGQQAYTVQVSRLAGESNTTNNAATAYVEVIDGRERVVIAASAPHPDIKAIKAALELESNLEVEVFIPSFGAMSPLKPGKPDLVILHQLPDMAGQGSVQINNWDKEGVPMWVILGPATQMAALNDLALPITGAFKPGQWDKVNARLKTGFTGFIIESGTATLLPKLPPIEVPFGKPQLKPGGVSILDQALGNVELGLPLLAANVPGGKRRAVLLGTGIWQWRLQEYAETGKHAVTDGLIKKVVQYLSAKDDKRKFRLYPVADVLYEGDAVQLQAELYNEVYEPVYGTEVKISVSKAGRAAGSFAFTPSEGSVRTSLGVLPAGVYSYTGTTTLNGKAEQVKGQFTVQAYQLEKNNTTANWSVLRATSAQTGGTFYTADKLAALEQQLLNTASKGQLRSYEDLTDVVNLKWIALAVAALAIVEWFLRKRLGAY